MARKNNISKGKTAEQVFYEFKEKYEIKNDNLEDTRKIIALRYEIAKTGYSSTRAVRLADNLSREAVAEFCENSEEFPGINIVVEPVRKYTSGTVASHILGYAGKITGDEYNAKKINMI